MKASNGLVQERRNSIANALELRLHIIGGIVDYQSLQWS